MQRRTMSTVALTALVLLAGCAGALGSAPGAGTGTNQNGATGANPAAATGANPASGGTASAGGGGADRSITVGASGQAGAEPNQVVLRVAVAATGPEASTARQRLAANVSEMRAALAEIGIESSQITTTHYDIDKRYRERPRPRSDEEPETHYRAHHAFRITLSDLDRTGTVIDTAVENGATSVDDVRFTLTTETKRKLHRRALSDAMASAREKAETLAADADLRVVGVEAVRTTDDSARPRYEAMATPTADAGGGTDLDTGPVTVTAQVVVAYNATDQGA